MANNISLEVPNAGISIVPGNKVQLGRFNAKVWIVRFGWYNFGGNRSVCGWYLEAESGEEVKPIFKIDLDDIYIISIG
jgi:hypothetical protein